MNGNTAESHDWPPKDGGGTVRPLPMAWSVETCRFAGGGGAALVSSLTLDSEGTANANSVNTVYPIAPGSENEAGTEATDFPLRLPQHF